MPRSKSMKCQKKSEAFLNQFKNTRLVYSSDKLHTQICQLCRTEPCKCRKSQKIEPSKILIKIRLEKNGRGGKLVTVLFNLPLNNVFFAALTKELKAICGAGGTLKDEIIEIQGDHREKIKSHLEKKGFQVKLAGG